MTVEEALRAHFRAEDEMHEADLLYRRQRYALRKVMALTPENTEPLRRLRNAAMNKAYGEKWAYMTALRKWYDAEQAQ